MVAALPLPALVTPDLAEALRAREPDVSIPKNCEIVEVYDAREEGGIMCALRLQGIAEDAHVIFASITHFDFDHRHPLKREIAAYQKRRIKKLSRLAE